MTDSMKFGPEWLRNMSNDVGNSSSTNASAGSGTVPFGISFNNNNNASNNTNNCGMSSSSASAAPRYQLAEFRYGREEMLSLYDKNVKLPELLPKFKKLFIEKMQCPLALLPPSTDDEVRLWQMRGSSAIGGLASDRGGGVVGLGSGNLNMSGLGSGTSLSGISGRGTRGSSIDRGRGRTRGLYHSALGGYQRSGFAYDEDPRGISGRSERQWTERNGTTGLSESLDWNGSSSTTSPRKDYLSRSNNIGESWRRSRLEDESQSSINGTSDGWRSSGSGNSGSMYKWPSRSTSWRGESDLPTASSATLQSDISVGNNPPHRLERSLSHQHNSTHREMDSVNLLRRSGINNNPSWDDDNLPEWAMDEPMEGGGSFDATGAFHGGEEEEMRKRKSDESASDYDQKDLNSNPPNKFEISKTSLEKSAEIEMAPPVIDSRDHLPTSDLKKTSSSSDNVKSSASNVDQQINESIVEIGKEMIDNGNISKESDLSNSNNAETLSHNENISIATHSSNPNMPTQLMNTTLLSESNSVDRMKEVANDIEKLIMDDDLLASDHDSAILPPNKKILDHRSLNNNSKVGGQKPFLNMVSNSDNCGLVGLQSIIPPQQAPQVIPHVPPTANNPPELWFYRDPQGKVQGPFTATEMAEWYRAGYFDESLFVRRVCDSRFSALGDLLKICGGAIPFLTSHLIPPLLNMGADLNIGPVISNANKPPPMQLSHSHQPPQSVQPNLAGLDSSQQDNMNSNAALNYHIQNVQKQHMLRQQALIIQKLSESDHWGLLSSEQQAVLISQRMAQVPMPDNILSHATAVANNNINQQQQSIMMHQLMANSNQISHQKSPVPNKPTIMKQQPNLPHIFNHHNPHHDFNPNPGTNNSSVNNNISSNDSVQQLLHTMSLSQIQIPPPVPMPSSATGLPHPSSGPHQPNPQQLIVENDPIKSLIYQLSMQKRTSPNLPQQQMSHAQNEKWIQGGGGGGPIHHDPSVVAVQHQSSQPLAQLGAQWNNANTPLSMWDISIPPNLSNTPGPAASIANLHSNLVPKSSMKTEMQILEEHLQMKMKEDHLKKEIEFLAAQQQKNQWNTQKNITQSMLKQYPNQQPIPSIQNPNPNHQQKQPVVQQLQPAVVTGKFPDLTKIGLTQQILPPPPPPPLPQHGQMPSHISYDEQQQLQQQLLGPTTTIKSDSDKSANEKARKQEDLSVLDQITDSNQIASVKQQPKSLKKNKTETVGAARGVIDDSKVKKNSKSDSISPENDATFMTVNSNSSNTPTSLSKQTAKEASKKKNKDRDAKAAEEKKRQQDEDDRQYLEEKKRLEDIAEQRKSKLMENSARVEDSSQLSSSKRNNLAASVAPWSSFTTGSSTGVSSSPSLAEIQRIERERRAEQMRIEQTIREQQQSHALLEQQQQKDSILKWNLKPQNHIKSLAEIQAEESKARQAILEREQQQLSQNQQNQKKDTDKFASLWNNSSLPLQWSSTKMWGDSSTNNGSTSLGAGSTSVSGFWEEPTKTANISKSNTALNPTAGNKILSKSQTVSNIQSQAAASKQNTTITTNNKATTIKAAAAAAAAGVIATSSPNGNATAKKPKANNSAKKSNANNDGNNEFTAWCSKALSAHVDVIDVPTFVSFLRDIESPYEVKDYIRMYLGETKECSEFAKQFLERRSKYKNMQRAANAHIDDMCSPAPAITPVNENQEAKNKGKKEKKKNKMTKLDSRILGFSITSAEDRLNVGDRDYARE